MKPTNEELQKFLNVFEKLLKFEMDHRSHEGWGVWDERNPSESLPIPEIDKVCRWLSEMAGSPNE